MTIVESLRDYLKEFTCLSVLDDQINVNYVDESNFSIEEIPVAPILTRYVDGSTKRQFQFAFTKRYPYSSEVMQNLENSSFYEVFSDELEAKNRNGSLPTLKDGLEPLKLEVISSSFVLSSTETEALYQIIIRFVYRKE